MISHVVLMKPRPDLSEVDRRGFASAFEQAVRNISSVRSVRVGRRVLHGAGYETGNGLPADYLAVIDFDDLDGLRMYLEHPAHAELGARFATSLAGAMVLDYETGGIDLIERWLALG
jgi:hypothetical protein